VRILGLAIEGQSAKALAALPEHLEAYPRDALVFSLALGAFGCTPSAAAPTTTPRGSRCAAASRRTTARTGGS
jgi:hypothetical protein